MGFPQEMMAASVQFYRIHRKPEVSLDGMGPLTDLNCWAVCKGKSILS